MTDPRFEFEVEVPPVPEYDPTRLVFRYTARNRYERCPTLVATQEEKRTPALQVSHIPEPPSPSLSGRVAPPPPGSQTNSSINTQRTRPANASPPSVSSSTSSIRPSPLPPRPSLGGSKTQSAAAAAAAATAAVTPVTSTKPGFTLLPDLHLATRPNCVPLLVPSANREVLEHPPSLSPPDSMRLYLWSANLQKSPTDAYAPTAPRAPPIVIEGLR